MKTRAKRLLSALLCTGLLAGMMPIHLAAVNTAQKSVALEKSYIYSSVGDISVKVTYTGWLGEIDAAACGIDEIRGSHASLGWAGTDVPGKARPIAVLKEGSKIQFEITAKDPAAYYNYCYNGGKDAEAMKSYDDCGGGCVYTVEENGAYGRPLFTMPKADGTVSLEATGVSLAKGSKLSAGSYSYQAQSGMYTYCFSAKDAAGYYPQDYIARYILGTALTINDAQLSEMKETGAMTFHKGTDLEYTHAWPGLAELMGVTPPTKKELSLLIQNAPDSASDGRQIYTITNNTGKQVNGCYALLSYWPKTDWHPAVIDGVEGKYGPSPEQEHFRGQLMTFDINLAPGKSMTGKCHSTAVAWSTMTHVWITFDDAAERDAFLKNDAIGTKQFDYFYELDMTAKGIQWMKDTFGITIKSGKPS